MCPVGVSVRECGLVMWISDKKGYLKVSSSIQLINTLIV